ncbi:16S rRNA (guanine(966)-N(2))-methyltransferase RsmD [Paenibacillus aceris]|uniref:16S rRNA (Guanine(966)-N(2))-methyltransferase RsmD n=1 Tax=Paenibacillus aceris TaxID=869555 RepID=A0ABS4HRB5_9BACL|nr:16S rRNA (guanine(966)-N(2))-methyltransferase RsmD [Paenibacillus aceris]MBP1961156.1 16S rRNA (guanine(966)-N(2))-methyltransferase RsmD [Paenibacillus aceris]NHW35191.1 16S rRNA (guanine(966)-N(2))-methyltransferase RsmD [Paenibacillus aceris]
MRVISGTAKGRSLKAVPGISTRPTTDKVKEAIFSMIGPYFDGGQVLDLFAGTGGLGIEALSRGMDKAVFIDIEKKSIDTIQHNLQTAGLKDQAEIYRTDAARALKALAKRQQQFQLVFLDPPYKMKVIAELISAMETQAIVDLNSTIVVEHDAKDVLDDVIGGFNQQRRADYGDTAVTIYKQSVDE